jgi:hypothetical protein
MRDITVVWKFSDDEEVFTSYIKRGINFCPFTDTEGVQLSVIAQWAGKFERPDSDFADIICMLEGKAECAQYLGS